MNSIRRDHWASGLFVLLLICCPANAKKIMSHSPKKESVEMRLVEKHYGRPPVMNLVFDVKIHNSAAEPLWFLLPERIAIPPLPVKIGVDGAVVSELTGPGRVVIVRFSGTGRFQAILLPPKAEIHLHHFPISFRGEWPKNTLPVEVIQAKSFTVAGQDAAAWLGVNPLCDSHADITASEGKVLVSKDTPGLEEVPVTISGEHKITLQVTIPQP